MYLTELIPAEDALARLQAAAPVDLRPIDAAYVELRRPALTAEINKVRYLLEEFVRPEFDVTDEALSQIVFGCYDQGAQIPFHREALSQIVFGWYDKGAQIPFHRGKNTKTLDVRRMLNAESHVVLTDGCVRIEVCTRCDNEGSLRPEIIVAAFDQAWRGLDPGVDEQIVSSGIQQLTVFD